MDYQSIVDVFGQLDIADIQRTGENHLEVPCVMAPYSEHHRGPVDNKRKGWVWINDDGVSVCGCHKCEYSWPIVHLMRTLTKKTLSAQPALQLAIQLEARQSGKSVQDYGTPYEVNDTLYTDIYDRNYRQNLEADMPWDWLANRGVSRQDVETFKIGLDVSSGRVVFPCIRQDGEIVGSQSRAIASDSSHRKYISNLPFKSGHHFFGEHLALSKGLLDEHAVALFEGPLDVAHATGVGMNNSLAVNKASISIDQAKLLREWGIEEIWLMLDPDKAGQDGIVKSKKVLAKVHPHAIIHAPKLPTDPKFISAEQYAEIIQAHGLDLDRDRNWRKHITPASLVQWLERLKTRRKLNRNKMK